tara:strand:- start:7487 stop:8428 length:942 start_codon:yes stop_codon:yes gene_type:complete
MFRNRYTQIHWTVSASIIVTLCSTGCRSGMSRMNMFGLKSEPSAEMLAGNGPTMTYPAPPSESATPQAIASIAAGTTSSSDGPITSPASVADTATAQVAGLDIDPGYVAPASSDSPVSNMAAAQANGIFNAKAPSYASAANTAAPSGYQYGGTGQYGSTSTNSAATTPSPAPSYASTTPASPASAYAQPASISPPADFAIPTSEASSGSSGGFTMPDNMTPSTSMATTSTTATSTNPASSFATPDTTVAAAGPEHRIATGDFESSIPAIDTGAPASAPSTSAGGYTPGSTSGAVGYPTGGYSAPSPTGSSYYR